MTTNKTVLSAALLSALGAAAIAPAASAVILVDGLYNVYVNTTPTGGPTTSGSTFYQIGKDGAWNSSFTLGGATPNNNSSQGMTDNGATSGTGQGSSIASDGFAGHWVISVAGTNVSFVSFAEDVIFGTGGGNFAQYGTVTGTGTIDQTTGALSITPTGRLGAFNTPVLFDRKWNVDNCAISTTGCADNGNTAWKVLTTGTSSSATTTGPTSINGAPVVSIGDIDSNGLADYKAIILSGGRIGSEWGGFWGAGYFEVYNVRLEFIAAPAAVPIPAAMWLFGSGILGLGAAARRQRRRRE